MHPPMTRATLSENLLAFFRQLRAEGFLVGPDELQAALRALLQLDLGKRDQVEHALCCIACSSREQAARFGALFRAYFFPEATAQPPALPARVTPGEGQEREQAPASGQHPPEEASGDGGGQPVPTPDDGEAEAATALSARFSPLAAAQAGELQLTDDAALLEAAQRLLARLKLGRSRRWRSLPRGRRFQLRRTLRRALSSGGEPLHPAFLGHPRRKPRVVLLLDGSRSMAGDSERLLAFGQALAQRAARVEVFGFSTALRRLTRQLRRTPASLSGLGEAWGGGTRIGGALWQLVSAHGAVLSRDTLIIIVSDGLDTGDPALLARAMRELHRRSGGVVWLNPLADTPGYQPLAGGMQAALPYVDHFAPASPAALLALSHLRLRR